MVIPNSWGDWMQLNQRLYGVFMRCKRTGLEPGVNERQVRWERAQHPNVLYPGLRKGEPARWGGYLDDVNGGPDQGQRVWGGARNAEEMAAAIDRMRAYATAEALATFLRLLLLNFLLSHYEVHPESCIREGGAQFCPKLGVVAACGDADHGG